MYVDKTLSHKSLCTPTLSIITMPHKTPHRHYCCVLCVMHYNIGSPVTFEVQVQPANNFPIDLYLLMDLSFSMDDDLDNLKRLGTSLGTYSMHVHSPTIHTVQEGTFFYLHVYIAHMLCLNVYLASSFSWCKALHSAHTCISRCYNNSLALNVHSDASHTS